MNSAITTATPPPQETALQESMLRLEAALLSPVVSGELRQWIEAVDESLASFGSKWVEFVNTVLHKQYAQIAKTDTNLLSRVDQMVEEDRHLLADLRHFEKSVKDLAVRARQVEKNEVKVADERLQVEKNGIELILRVKKQQSSATTWLNEDNYRDLGSGD
jgi:hypothetical protein